jgi:cytoskeletal protein CcmA (bactofilin family)
MNLERKTTTRDGVALLVVLFIVMIITVLSLGFLSQSDTELACGNNMLLRTQMDYLAESGLEHARGLILHPQDVSSEYWSGAASQQLAAGSLDYYDIAVSLDSDPIAPGPSSCNYIIDCNAYRLREGQRIGFSGVRAKLRLDPCIALWTGADTIVSNGLTINGDVYSNGNLTGSGIVNGDAFASGFITASNIKGRRNESVATAPVDWPEFDINNFSSTYYIDSVSYSVEVIDSNISNIMYQPSGNNPAGICYCHDPNNPVSLNGNVTIYGTLAVDGDLTVGGTNNVIVATKNFPALIVTGKVIIEDGGVMQIIGLARIGQRIEVGADAQYMDVNGGLCIANGTIEGLASSSVSIDITANPSIAAIQVWPTAGTPQRWSPAVGAFFRSIEQK